MSSPDTTLPEIDFGGETYRLGTLLPAVKPQTMPKLTSAPGYRRWSKQEILDAIKGKPAKARDTFSGDWILNQKSLGSCNAAAAVAALRRAMFRSGRNTVPQFSWEFLYAQINGGRDQGSMLDDGMQALLNIGVPTLNPQKHPLNRHYLKNDYSPEEYNEAKSNRAEQCYEIDTEIDLATLVLSRQGAAIVAVHVGSNFMSLDRNGFAGVDNGPGNHAVCVDDVALFDGGLLGFDMPNSWGTSFGEGGRAYLSWNGHMARTNEYHCLYAVLAASNPNDGAPVAN